MRQVAERIRNALPASQVIGRKVVLKPKGNQEYLGLCPFHTEKSPSFTVSNDKQFYHCFGCGAHGDIFKFVMENEGLGYKDTLALLANEAGVELPKFTPQQIDEEKKVVKIYEIFHITTSYYHKALYEKANKHALAYLNHRGLSDELIKEYQLGFAPENQNELLAILRGKFTDAEIIESTVMLDGKGLYSMFRGRVIFPIFDRRSRPIAFGGRTMEAGVEPKYLNSPDNPIFKKGEGLYGLNIAAKDAHKSNEIILVEGYMDVLSLANRGIHNAVAPLGTAVKVEQLKLLWQFSNEPTICMDADSAGQRSTSKMAHQALEMIEAGKSLKFISLDGGKDPDEVISSNGIDYFKNLLKNALPLSDMLFKMEKELKPIKTPEQITDFKKRLLKLAESIKERDLAAQYKNYFMQKFFETFAKGKKKVKQTIDCQKSVLLANARESIDELAVLFYTLCTPELLEDSEFYEQLINMQFTSNLLDNIRGNVLSICDTADLEAKKILATNLLQEMLDNPQLKCVLEGAGFNWDFVHSKKSTSDVKEELERLFKIVTLKNIKLQIVQFKNELMSNPYEEFFLRLTELKKVEEQLKTELGIQ